MKKELTPRKRQALEMRAKIQSTALSLFNQEGFENVSVEEIAQAAQVSEQKSGGHPSPAFLCFYSVCNPRSRASAMRRPCRATSKPSR